MRDVADRPVHGITTLSAKQREYIERDGRVARALEAAQRRRGGRFSRITDLKSASGGDRLIGRRHS